MSVDRIDRLVQLRARTPVRRRTQRVVAPGSAPAVPSIEAAALVRVARAVGSLGDGASAAATRTGPRPVRRQLYVVPGEGRPTRALDSDGSWRLAPARRGDPRAALVRGCDQRAADVRGGDRRVADVRGGDRRVADVRGGDRRMTSTSGRGAVRRVAPRREGYAPLRLTRRGRVVARLMLVLTALLVLVGIAAAANAVSDPPAPAGSRTAVVVEPGDTLWNIAERHAPDADRRRVIAEIRRLNGLDGSRVEVGQELILPRR